MPRISSSRKQEIQRQLTSEKEAAQLDAKFHSQVAEEAREGQQAARQQMADCERRMHEQATKFAEERAELTKKLELRAEQLTRK